MEAERVFVIGDTHFGDENILRYESRPFETGAQMNQALVDRWNAVVGPEDTVFHLGDVSSLSWEEDLALLSRLQGKKLLVMGNHDRHRSPSQWRELGFAEVLPWPILYQGFFLLSHEPLYVNRHMPYANVFGHVHGNPTYRDVSPRSFCACCERTDFAPLSFSEIRERIAGEN